MLGSIIGGAIGIGGSIFGGIAASNAAKKVKAGVEAQKRENEAWYNRRYNEDATQRADAQRVLSIMGDKIRERNRAAAGAAAVMGGTEESVAATKAANAEALADAASQIAVAGEARKDKIEEAYQTRKDTLNSQMNALEAARAQAIGQSIGGVADAAGSMGIAMDDYLANKKNG